MTIFGPDISSYEGGVNVSAMPEPFIMLKCTEGTYYKDDFYAGWLAQAKSSGKLVVAYHFLKTESSPQAQAAYLAAHIGDKSLPVMLDIETEGSSSPNIEFITLAIDTMRSAGLNVRLAYLPHWYWQNIGSPLLTGLVARRVGLVSSAYPGRRGERPVVSYADSGGDTGTGWAVYGKAPNPVPLIWQFTDAAMEQKSMDFNAYRGTIEQLAAFLHGSTAQPSGGTSVGNIPATIGQKWPEIAPEFPANGPYDDSGAIIWADGGARAAALYAKQARDAVNALAAKITATPPVDVAALAAQIVAAIEPHVIGVDAQAVAVAVQAQLAQALSGHGAG